MSEQTEALKDHDRIKREIEDTRQALEALGTNATEPLVTSDGFPRNDIDVPAARELRVKLIRLENDLQASTDRMYELLNQHFSAARAQQPPKPKADTKKKPFSKVKSVLSGSLGDAAGIQADDQIISFGSAKSINDLITQFKESTGRNIKIEILRPSSREIVELEVFAEPERSLGLHIVPL